MSYSQFQYRYYRALLVNDLTFKYYDSRHLLSFVLNTMPLYSSLYLTTLPILRNKVHSYKAQFTVWPSTPFKIQRRSQVKECVAALPTHTDVYYSRILPTQKRFVISLRLHLATVHYNTNRLLLAAVVPKPTLGQANLLLRVSSQLYLNFAQYYVTHYWFTVSFLHKITSILIPAFDSYMSAPATQDKGLYNLFSIVRNLRYL